MREHNDACLGQPNRIYGVVLIEKTGCYIKAVPAKKCRAIFKGVIKRRKEILQVYHGGGQEMGQMIP